jgi:hypothetical protein
MIKMENRTILIVGILAGLIMAVGSITTFHTIQFANSTVPCPTLQGDARYDWKCGHVYDGAYDPNCDNN